MINFTNYLCFRKLSEEYKTKKFVKLYNKMYEFMLSVPKDKIIISKIKNIEKRKRNEYVPFLFEYVNHFLTAKDFYHWRERVYKLMTVKIGSKNFKKFELFYGKKAEEFFNEGLEKRRNTCLRKYGVNHPFKSKEVQKKAKKTFLKMYGCEHPFQSKEVRERIIETNRKKYNADYYNQSIEGKMRLKKMHENRTDEEKKIIRSKTKQTNLERYNVEYYFGKNGGYSNIAAECLSDIDIIFGMPEESLFYPKNSELTLKDKDGYIKKYDYCIPSKKIIIEFQGSYIHGLINNQKKVFNHEVSEIWEKDKYKKELAEMNGFTVYYIREDEYLKNPEKIFKYFKSIKEGIINDIIRI